MPKEETVRGEPSMVQMSPQAHPTPPVPEYTIQASMKSVPGRVNRVTSVQLGPKQASRVSRVVPSGMRVNRTL